MCVLNKDGYSSALQRAIEGGGVRNALGAPADTVSKGAAEEGPVPFTCGPQDQTGAQELPLVPAPQGALGSWAFAREVGNYPCSTHARH